MSLSRRHQDLLAARGLDVELLERLNVRSSRRGSDWIEIPYVMNGRPVNTKFRTIAGEKEFCQETGGKKCFWNIDILSDRTLDGQPLVITEGEFDAISAIQAGFVRAISVPDGAPREALGKANDGPKYSYVLDAMPLLRDVKEIILATDGDAPGIALLNDLAIRLGRPRCKWVRYPRECKDLNDALQRYGERGVTETLNRAQWMHIDGVYRMSELPPLPMPEALEIGIDGLAPHYKIRVGDFCVVLGIPGHGKTSFVNEIACRMAANHGWVCAIASFEQRPQIDHRRALRTFYSGKRVINQTAEEIRNADEWIDRHFVFIVPGEDEDAELGWMCERVAAAVIQHGARLVIIDPFNEMDHVWPREMTETQYVSSAIKTFRRLAAKYQIHVIVVVHPAKMQRGKDGRIPIPTLYDASGSAHFFNKADVGIIVHKEEENRTIIRVAKSRYHDAIGRPGDIDMMWIGHEARFQRASSADA